MAASIGGCGSDNQAPSSDSGSDTSAAGARSTGTFQNLFDVGDHKLYMACRGRGTPTVVYLHGSVRDPGKGGSANAGRIPALLAARHRICVYDRANVGLSGTVPGPLTGKSSVKDLHALLAAAHLKGPYVLLGASIGGAIADIYAATYPKDVAGMVLLDSTVPAYLGIYKRLYEPGFGPKPGEWRKESERLDRLTTFRQAAPIQARRAKIPVTYIAAKLLLARKIADALRKAQRAFVRRFDPGRRIEVATPHSMEPVIPETIAREVERVIAAGDRARGS